MNILFVSDTYFPHLNGVYYFVCRLAPRLQEKGYRVAVIAPSETMLYTRKEIDGIDVYGIPSLPTLYYPKVRFPVPIFQKRKLKRILKEFKPDVIHVQDHFTISKMIIDIGNDLGIPLIGTNHFMTENLTSFVRSEKWKKRLSALLWKSFSKTYNRVSVVTTPSETAAGLIRPKLLTPVICISSGIDLNMFKPGEHQAWVRQKYHIPDKPVVLFVGRLDPEKNIEETLSGVARALKQTDFCFVVVGNGVRKAALELQAKKLDIADHVVFTGYVSDEDLPYVYRTSSCFIISSTAELLSLSTLQGMAAALPIIAVNAGALGELVSHGVNGYLYETGDEVEMALHICLVLEPEINKKMGDKSFEFVQKHDMCQTIQLFEQLYQQFNTNPRKVSAEKLLGYIHRQKDAVAP
jgi:1,2-diacylglycerol 3-alpha-glucosyltransferase